MDKTMVELFAGVGGFRLGFERLNTKWKTVWFSQWEPNRKKQDAYDCYVAHFGNCLDNNGEMHTNDDICLVDKSVIPDHSVLVGGFPCQDFSVAHNLTSSRGIEGKKGVLWWQIRDVLAVKKPAFCLFENVDRLLKSPAKMRGRDFGIMLGSLNELGYSVEWRVVDASFYGGVQRRKRVFIFAYRNDTDYGKRVNAQNMDIILQKIGFMARSFPVKKTGEVFSIVLESDIGKIYSDFMFSFKKAGMMKNGMICTCDVEEQKESPVSLGSILQQEVSEEYYLSKEKVDKFKWFRTSKRIERTSRSGHTYMYAEGAMEFPDSLAKPSRTMLTSEGSLNRCSHIIEDPQTHRYRILTPLEAERLQGFDDEWTNTGMSQRMRYYCMGNALVVPMVTRMAQVLDKIVDEENV